MDTTHGLFDFKIDIYYLVGLLNSKVLNYWHKTYTSEKGRAFAEIKIANMKNAPIKLLENKSIINLVRLIIDLKEKDPAADVSVTEKEIDELVMDSYGLNDEEKEMIRNS